MKQRHIHFIEEGFLFSIDKKLSEYQVRYINRVFLDSFFVWLATLDKKYFALGAIYGYLFWNDLNLVQIASLLIVLIFSDQLCRWCFKKPIHRLRPIKWYAHKVIDLHESHPEYAVLEKFRPYVAWFSHASMCSSHTANFFAQGLLLNYFVPDYGFWILCLFISVGFGRMYIGAHWFSDVCVGWAVGYISYITVLHLFNF